MPPELSETGGFLGGHCRIASAQVLNKCMLQNDESCAHEELPRFGRFLSYF